MKPLANKAVPVLERHLLDLDGAPETVTDVRVLRYVIQQLKTARQYILPVGGAVIREQMAAEQLIRPADIEFERSSFIIQFMTTEGGYDPAVTYTVPIGMRLALVQDLSDHKLLTRWRELLQGSQHDLHPDEFLVIPVNRMHAPGAREGVPGNRGWILSWALASLRRSAPIATLSVQPSPSGPIEISDLDVRFSTLGFIGECTAAEFSKAGVLITEYTRETMLEMTAAVDLGTAMSRGLADLRRAPITPGDIWYAGRGPRSATIN